MTVENILKFERCGFTKGLWMCSKGEGRVANSADPDQTAPSGFLVTRLIS